MVRLFARQIQEFSARYEYMELRTACEQDVHQARAGVKQMLAIVDDKQEMLCLQPLDQGIERRTLVQEMEAKRRPDMLDEQIRFVEVSAVNPSGAICEGVLQLLHDLQRQPRLATPSRPPEGHKPLLRQAACERLDVLLASNERRPSGYYHGSR
jgi:hypothetical protein